MLKINHIKSYIFQALIFLVPIFFLPWGQKSVNIDNYNKNYLLWYVVPLILFLFFFNSLKQGKIEIKRNFIDKILIIFLAAYFLSSVFSFNFYTSLFGAHSSVGLPFWSLLILILLYFFANNNIENKDKLKQIIKVLFYSFCFVVVLSFIMLIGLWQDIFSNNSFLLKYLRLSIGSLEYASLYLAIMNIFLVSLIGTGELFNKWQNRIAHLFFWLSILLLILINFYLAWIIMASGLLFLLYRNLLQKNKPFVKKHLFFAVLSIVFLVISIYINNSEKINQHLALNLQLNHIESIKIISDVIKQRPIIGHGPEAFSYIYSQFRNPELNNTPYWYLRFNQPSSFIIGLLLNTGLLNFIIYIIFIVFILYKANFFYKFKSDDIYISSFKAALLALIVGQLVYSANIVLLFLFWLFLGILFGFLSKDKYLIKIDNNKFYIYRAILIFGFILLFCVNIYTFKNWLAEIYYKQGKAGIHSLLRAIDLNPNKFNYQIVAAKVYKNQALNIKVDKEDKQRLVELGGIINESIKFADKAIKTAPFSVTAYETKGIIYRDLSQFFSTGNGQAIDAFQSAVSLEPSNPVLVAELGKLYLAEDQAEKAIDNLETAIKLKENYYEAKFYLAKSHVKDQQAEKALQILEELSQNYPSIDVLYEKGRIYYNLKRYDEAVKAFNQVISVDPIHANALYSLALSLEQKNDKATALYYYKKVLELNPQSEDVLDRIKKLDIK